MRILHGNFVWSVSAADLAVRENSYMAVSEGIIERFCYYGSKGNIRKIFR